MLEIKKNKSGKFRLFAKDEELSAKINFDRNRDAFTLTTGDLSTSERLINNRFKELPDVYYLSFPIKTVWSKPLDKVIILQSKIDKVDLRFRFDGKPNKWKNKKNYFRYFSAFSLVVAESNTPKAKSIKGVKKEIQTVKLSTNQNSLYGFEIIFVTRHLPLTLKEEVESYLEILHYFHKQAIKIANSYSKEDLILSSFNFPEDLKVPCEQYLLYFAQFLKDLGINATSNLKEEAGKVLFSVTPTDDFEALDKIREALAIYLSLSSNPIPHSTGDRTIDMVLSGARANAKHLESQLELAIAKLQFKEATLELKDATIEQNQLALWQRDNTIKDLKEMLARGNIFEESLEKVVINGEVVEETSLYRFSREDDIEVEATPVLDESNEETRLGLVKFHEVTKLKDYGVSLDLPKAIRDLIDYFKRDKNK